MPEPTRTHLSVKQERAILVGVLLPKSKADPRDPLGELNSLAQTAGAREFVQSVKKLLLTSAVVVGFSAYAVYQHFTALPDVTIAEGSGFPN